MSNKNFKIKKDENKVLVKRKYYKFTTQTKMPPLLKRFWIRLFEKHNESSGIHSIIQSFYTTITFIVCQESHHV